MSEIEKLTEELNRVKAERDYYKKLAYTDQLTKLNNRRILDEVDRFDSIIMCDVDHFKSINDTYGHLMGDKVLVSISNILKENTRKEDLVCRWGGEEFIILLKNCSKNYAYKKAEQLRKKMEALDEDYQFRISMSFGISEFEVGKSLDQIQKEADIALYYSKEHGRNSVTVYKDIQKDTHKSL